MLFILIASTLHNSLPEPKWTLHQHCAAQAACHAKCNVSSFWCSLPVGCFLEWRPQATICNFTRLWSRPKWKATAVNDWPIWAMNIQNALSKIAFHFRLDWCKSWTVIMESVLTAGQKQHDAWCWSHFVSSCSPVALSHLKQCSCRLPGQHSLLCPWTLDFSMPLDPFFNLAQPKQETVGSKSFGINKKKFFRRFSLSHMRIKRILKTFLGKRHSNHKCGPIST